MAVVILRFIQTNTYLLSLTCWLRYWKRIRNWSRTYRLNVASLNWRSYNWWMKENRETKSKNGASKRRVTSDQFHGYSHTWNIQDIEWKIIERRVTSDQFHGYSCRWNIQDIEWKRIERPIQRMGQARDEWQVTNTMVIVVHETFKTLNERE